MPLHPEAASIVDQWLDLGFEQEFGRPPQPDDFLFPRTRPEQCQTSRYAYYWWLKDVEQVGLAPRGRAIHDARRTGHSAAVSYRDLARGGEKDKLAWITHGRPRTIEGAYTVIEWRTLCVQVDVIPWRVRSMAELAAAKREAPALTLTAGPKLYSLRHSDRHSKSTLDCYNGAGEGIRTLDVNLGKVTASLITTTEIRQ